MTIDISEFRPPVWLRFGMVQTILASSEKRKNMFGGFEKESRRVVLDAGPGIKTTCYINEPFEAQGLIVLLHGWLGTPQSGYVVSAAKALFEAGFSVARLTLPEQGESALMTAEVIDLTRHDVVRNALRNLVADFTTLPLGLLGFSLGGNFALRIARDLNQEPINNLAKVMAVSPVIEPAHSCDKIDSIGIIRRYFLQKFQQLTKEKQAAFPDLKAVREIEKQKSIRGLTEILVKNWTDYPTADDYFAGYRINTNDLQTCPVDTTLLTAADDPIIVPKFAMGLSANDNFERILVPFGGHNGFYERFPRKVFSDAVAVDRFKRALVM